MQTKMCKYCKMQVPAKAVMCPYCGKEIALSTSKLVALGIVVIMVVTVVFLKSINTNEQPAPPPRPINAQPVQQAPPINTTQSTQLNQITINKDIIRIGDTHDSVVERIPKIATIDQKEIKSGDNLVVDRRYRYGGKDFTLTFTSTPPEIIYRVVKITEHQK